MIVPGVSHARADVAPAAAGVAHHPSRDRLAENPILS